MSTFETISQFSRMLKNLDQWLQAGEAYAQKKNFAPDVFAQARLAPDQYALAQQVQSACDAAKYAAAYLSGQKAPSHPDTEKTMGEHAPASRPAWAIWTPSRRPTSPGRRSGASRRRGWKATPSAAITT